MGEEKLHDTDDRRVSTERGDGHWTVKIMDGDGCVSDVETGEVVVIVDTCSRLLCLVLSISSRAISPASAMFSPLTRYTPDSVGVGTWTMVAGNLF